MFEQNKYRNKKVKKPKNDMDFTEEELESLRSLIKFAILMVVMLVLYGCFWYYKNVIDNPQNRYMKGSRYAYRLLQEGLGDYYTQHGFIYNPKKADDTVVCNEIAKRYSNGENINCYNSNNQELVKNFNFAGTKVSVYGLEKPMQRISKKKKNYLKDFIIDINGEEGDNKIGTDRIPVRLHSKGVLTGQITPVNCSASDAEKYGWRTSDLCKDSKDNYLAKTYPLGFNIIQISRQDKKIYTLRKNLTLLEADCMAYNGATIATKEYCKAEGLEQLNKCSSVEEYPCLIDISK